MFRKFLKINPKNFITSNPEVNFTKYDYFKNFGGAIKNIYSA